MLKKFFKLIIFVLSFSLLYSNEAKLKDKGGLFSEDKGLLKLEMRSYVKKKKKIKLFYKFVNEDKLYYRELSYYEKFNPDFIEIDLSKNEIKDINSNSNKLEKLEEIVKKHNKNMKVDKSEIMDYYIESYDRDKVITKSGRFIEYIFDGLFSEFYVKREIKIDKEKFDKNFNKALEGGNFVILNIFSINNKIVSKEKEKKITIITEKLEDLKKSSGLIMYCYKDNVCEKIDLDSNKVKIIKKSDYIEVKINDNEGFYIVENYYEPISNKYHKEIHHTRAEFIPYEKLNISDFNYFLKLLRVRK